MWYAAQNAIMPHQRLFLHELDIPVVLQHHECDQQRWMHAACLLMHVPGFRSTLFAIERSIPSMREPLKVTEPHHYLVCLPHIDATSCQKEVLNIPPITYRSLVFCLPFPLSAEKIIHKIDELFVTAPAFAIGQPENLICCSLLSYLLNAEMLRGALHTG